MTRKAGKRDEKPEWADVKIRANHNYFIRSVIVAVVSQILVGVISAFLIFGSFILFGPAYSKDIKEENTINALSVQPTNNLSSSVGSGTKSNKLGGFVITAIVIVSCNAVYFIYNLWNLTSINKEISYIEDEILKD